MLRYSLYALAGACSLQFFRTLPPGTVVVGISSLALLALAWRRDRKTASAAAFALGGAVMWIAASGELAGRLDRTLQADTLTITARVIDFPTIKSGSIRLLVTPLTSAGLPGRIRLSWYRPDGEPALGEVWQFRTRLKRPRGFSNPGGFDYEGWLHRQRIGATGYVIGHAKRITPGDALDLRATLRRQLAARIDALFAPGESRAVLKAIAVGARGEISEQQWQLYARTGTSHLMAISGLHIGLAAGGAFVLVWLLVAPFLRRSNVRDLALVAAVLVSFCYAELSGFAVPAKRAFLMALLVAAAVIVRRRIAAQYVLGTVCLFVLLSDPLSIYAPGFILSFLAVALLLWSALLYQPSCGPSDRWWQWPRLVAVLRGLTRIQMVLLFGLMPVTIGLFGRVSLLAPLTNMLVVPMFNLVTVPACLLGLLLDGPAAPAGDLLLKLAFASVEIALSIIGWVGQWPFSSAEPPLGGYRVILIAGSTAIWAILPPGWPGRHLAFVALAATLLYKPPTPPANCLDLHALDVGQGLAIVLRTQRHTLVYDTGPAFGSGTSTAKLVIGPFLRAKGVSTIDALVVSHSDLDHSGGVQWLVGAFDVDRLMLGEELEVPARRGRRCRSGQAWHWDGIQFSFLHPGGDQRWQGNDASCVLLVQIGEHKLLIPGDIEAISEKSIVSGQGIATVDLVIVPHHGSRTSSSPDFVAMLRPSLAIVAAGYRNRWGFPKPDIVARWESVGARVLTTGQIGAVSRRYCSGKAAGRLRLERDYARRYWHDSES